jgi:glycosyltransferase involved in cell wall biosynthesis
MALTFDVPGSSGGVEGMTISVIVCAHNEARYLPACLHSVLAQSWVPDELLVINNASTDETPVVASQIPHVRVVDEPRKGLVVARETGRRHAAGEILITSNFHRDHVIVARVFWSGSVNHSRHGGTHACVTASHPTISAWLRAVT